MLAWPFGVSAMKGGAFACEIHSAWLPVRQGDLVLSMNIGIRDQSFSEGIVKLFTSL